MGKAISETNRRREIQQRYNEEHGITPQTIQKAVRDLISISKASEEDKETMFKDAESMNRKELTQLISKLTKKMHASAADLNFEAAAQLRDQIYDMKKMLQEMD